MASAGRLFVTLKRRPFAVRLLRSPLLWWRHYRMFREHQAPWSAAWSAARLAPIIFQHSYQMTVGGRHKSHFEPTIAWES